MKPVKPEFASLRCAALGGPARLLRLAAPVALAVALGACGVVGVKPWERDLMARPDMAADANPVDGAVDDHVYFSKEATNGGRGFGGGGCGCN
jgi:hypothetical protein